MNRNQKFYHKRKLAGLCVRCGHPRIDDKIVCPECRKSNSENTRVYYQYVIKPKIIANKSLCIQSCGRLIAFRRMKYCDECAFLIRKRLQIQIAKRRRMLHLEESRRILRNSARKRAEHCRKEKLCYYCHIPINRTGLCDSCRIKLRDRQKKRRASLVV